MTHGLLCGQSLHVVISVCEGGGGGGEGMSEECVTENHLTEVIHSENLTLLQRQDVDSLV
jgi:hypothetical protein